jgi:hypothetical protein
VTGL